MNRVSMTTVVRRDDAGAMRRVVRFARETSSRIYEMEVDSAGSVAYFANTLPVDSLPNLPSVRELLGALTLRNLVRDLHAHEPESEPYRAAWWALKHATEKL